MASSMVSRWVSDQNILLVAPSALTPGSPPPPRTPVRVRRPLIRMIWILDHWRARRWRTVGSVDGPVGPVDVAMISSSSFSKRRWPVVADVPRSNPSVVIATFQPLLTPPTTLASGQRASVKKTSLNSADPSTWTMGRDLDARLLHRHEQVADARRASDADGSVRASRKMKSAYWAWVVQIF